MTSVGYASLQIIPSMRGMDARINRELAGFMPAAGRRAGEQMGTGVSEGFGARVGGMTKYAKAAAVGVGIALGAGAIGVAKWGIGIAAANEQAQISFETMLGSGAKARTFLDDLRDFAAETPFEFPELQTAASSLISAGIEADKVIPIMTNLGNATAGMGTGSEGIKRATVALQQMQAAGKITGEDLNQLRDAGIPVYDLLAASTGKAKEEVAALAQAGKLGKEELDALMTGLESGKGLERFSGLMDKQSESLTGLMSSLKDNLGQGLATALQPSVDLIKDGLPAATDLATDGISLLGDGLAFAIAKGQDFAAWITPMAQDLGSHLLPVLDDLVQIGRNALPDALGVAGGAVVVVYNALIPLIDGVGKLTGFLADHEEVVTAVAAAYVAWKFASIGAAWAASASAGVQTVTTSLVGMRTAIQSIAATRGVSEATATLGALRSTLTAPVSGGAAAAGGLVGIAVGATIAIKSLERSAENGRETAQKFVDSLQIDESSSTSMQRGMVRINDQMKELEKQASGGYFELQWQRINPWNENTIDEARAGKEKLAGIVADYAKDLGKVYGAAKLLGTTGDDIDAWVEKLDLDTAELGPKRIAWAIGEARSAAENGTPATDKLTEAYKTLSTETSNSTEKIDAWKTALDTALDNPQSLFDATTAYAEGLAALEETLTAGSWGQFGTDTEAGRANRDALSSMVDNVQALSGAYADLGNTDKAADAIKTGRDAIIEAGIAAGWSRGEVTAYVDSLGLTEGTWLSQVQLNGAEGAKQRADDLKASLEAIDDKTYTVYLNLISERYDQGIESGAIAHQGTGHDPKSNGKTGTVPPMPAGSAMPTTGGDSSSGRSLNGATVNVIAQGASSREVSDDLLWLTR